MQQHVARFFRIDRRVWASACECGLIGALVYTVLAAGCMGKTRRTKWGALGISKVLRVPRARVRDGLRILESKGLLRAVGASVRELVEHDAPDYIWLPQTLLFGVGEDSPPLVRLRETGDVLLLRLLVDLYGLHELADDGGLPLWVVRKPWKKESVAQFAHWTVWAYREGHYLHSSFSRKDPVFAPHAGRGVKPWWDRIELLQQLGFLQSLPRLVESEADDAILVFTFCPYGSRHDVQAETQVALAMTTAAEALLEGADVDQGRLVDAVLVPLRAHMTNAAVFSGFRLRYRPHTSATTRWLMEMDAAAAEWCARYDELATAWLRKRHAARA